MVERYANKAAIEDIEALCSAAAEAKGYKRGLLEAAGEAEAGGESFYVAKQYQKASAMRCLAARLRHMAGE